MTGKAIRKADKGGAIAAPVSAADLIRASVSANTARAYAAAWRRLDGWLAGQALTDSTLADYIASISAEGLSPAVGNMAAAAVRFRAKWQGVPSPVGPQTSQALAGFRRTAQDRGRGQVQGIQWAQADAAAALAANGGGTARGLRDAAIIAVGSDAMLRSSELSALKVRDIAFEADGTGRLVIRKSKTDQEGAGAVLYLGKPTADRVRTWIAAAGIEGQADARLFQRLDKAGKPRGPLSPQSVRAIIAARAKAAGIEGGRVSGHSLRVGAAQSLASAGASLVEMQTAGRWQSPAMPARYARAEIAGRGAVARLRYRA